tara:strand:+ start:370 stop:1512 length:1143 start_codon:yes stop_codon:yes gene_type:complete
MGMTMEEYVNAYYGGELGISKRYGISKADDLTYTSDPSAAFNTTFGAKVYNQLNTKSEVFKLLKKEPWTQSGWRVLTGRHAQTAGVAENDSEAGGALPDTDKPDLVNVTATLKQVVSTWEISTKAAMLSEADDGLGNLAAFMRKENSEAHMYSIDDMLLTTVDTPASNNFESLDRLGTDAAARPYIANLATDLDMFDITRDGTAANAWAEGNCVLATAGSAGHAALTLSDLDDLIQEALENGVNYSSLIFLTGYDTYQNLKALMQNDGAASAWSYSLAQGGAGSMNGVAGEGGLAFDSRVGSYDGIPIFLSQHVEKDTTSRMHLLDMENIAFRVAAPTTYVDSTNVAVTQKMSHEFALITAGELICYKFKTQGSIRNLNA